LILFCERTLWQVRGVVSLAERGTPHLLIVFCRSRFLIGARIKGMGTLFDKKDEGPEHTTLMGFAQTRYTWRDSAMVRKA
jgi:hypothetical protein